LPEVAGNIDRLVRSLGGLLHGLLDLSRLSAECFVAERKRISLERLVGDICDEFELNSENKHVRLIRELNQVRLFDDPIAIARITRNLLDNAFKYTSNGHVLIRTHSMDGLAFLSVEDTGKGIPLSEQKRVFEEFYQMDNYDHDQSKGAGLGLAIIQRLCEVIGAKISLVSELGLGSKFSVLFNSVCVGNDSSYKKAVKSTDLMCLQGKNIYVLDDEIDILDSMCMLLNSWGIQVKTANSPEAAEALFKKSGKPDLFIVDLWLQGEKFGLELANRFKEKYGYFSVLAVTGETTLAPLGKTDAAKYPLLLKPINSEILYDAISKGLTTVLHPIDCAELCPIDCFQKKHPAPKAELYSGFIDGGHSGLLTARTGC
jgi:CheY-like chemotaxis protein/two-component sensor histidine kinase